MADFPNFLDPQALFGTATSQSANYWLALGINTILTAIVGGIVLLVLAEVFSHKFGESIKPQNAFLVALIGSVVSNFGVIGLLGGVLPGMPLIVLSLAVWFLLIKVFFGQMKILHALLVAVIFFALSMLLVPYLTNIVAAYIPFGTA